MYVHVDGEGYLISEKCLIEVTNVDQILMNISKVKTPSSRYLGDILDVLSKSADEDMITKEQRDLLYQKFVKNL